MLGFFSKTIRLLFCALMSNLTLMGNFTPMINYMIISNYVIISHSKPICIHMSISFQISIHVRLYPTTSRLDKIKTNRCVAQATIENTTRLHCIKGSFISLYIRNLTTLLLYDIEQKCQGYLDIFFDG